MTNRPKSYLLPRCKKLIHLIPAIETHQKAVVFQYPERYSALADQPGIGYVRIARMLGKEALKTD
jgi:hypothetical protein